MTKSEVIIVGGGPAGSSCAWQLRRRGVDCLILDKAKFPRVKLCAGWITPEVVADLEMDPATYPHRFLTFDSIRMHLYGLASKRCAPQHSIRRYEFDEWLLKRSGAPVREHEVRHIERRGERYFIDGEFECTYLIGAGGTSCPVYRSQFREANPRIRALQVAALEHELPYEWNDPNCHLWFFEHGLPGYSWYVPKQDGYLNLGVGGIAARMKSKGQHLNAHWDHFLSSLRRRDLIGDSLELKPQGYSYYMRDKVDIGRIGNAFVIGDAAGLATRDMGEGIGPAVRSGMLVADAIVGGLAYDLRSVSASSLPGLFLPPGFVRRAMEGLLLRRSMAASG